MCDNTCICYLQKQINNKVISGLQAQAVGSCNKLIDPSGVLIFDDTTNNISNSVSLNTTTGIFTANKSGNILIHYYVNINGTESQTDVSFSINGIISTASNAVQGQMSGFALLYLNAGETFSLINASGEKVLLAGSDIQAGIVVITV